MTKFQLDQSFGRVLGVAYTHLHRRLQKHLKENNLSITADQFRVLTQLWQSDGCSQQELALGSNRDRANVTRIIDILEREGILERRDHETDRRVYRIYLTNKGKNMEQAAAAAAQASIKDAQKGISKSDLDICMAVLKKSIQNLR
jgi:DNA-binding MarR family transcriptional regulator